MSAPADVSGIGVLRRLQRLYKWWWAPAALSDVLAVVVTISLIEFIKLEKIGIQAPFRSPARSPFSSGPSSSFTWA